MTINQLLSENCKIAFDCSSAVREIASRSTRFMVSNSTAASLVS